MRQALLPAFSRVLSALLLASAGVYAQTITGTIVGTVTDPSGAAVVGADVTATQTTTSAQRKTKALADGNFTVSALEPGTYDLSVSAPGFKTVDKTGLVLTAAERLSAGTITLQIGQTSEAVTVKADIAVVQTASGEKSGVLTTQQLDSQPIKGRNVITFLQLLPGVVDTNNADAPDRNFAIGLSINGNRRNAIGTSIDGVQTQDSGTGWISTANVSIDAIAEVKVLLNNYQAEYGRTRGAGVLMIGKSGTREFHGSFNYFKRHEQFNANDFFNNRNGIVRPRYRYNMYSYTIGGPAYIPKLFNRDKNKLFFFWSQEIWPQKVGQSMTTTMPTELERVGNFSQTVDASGRPITIRDPLTGQPFPGNIIPSDRIDPNGQALLRLLPLPNFNNVAISGRQYNYVNQVDLEKPQRLQTLKIDNNLTSSDVISVTWSRQKDTQTGTNGLATPNANWPAVNRTFKTIGNVISARHHHIFSPTTVNELVLGKNWRVEDETIPEDVLARFSRTGVGYNAPQPFSGANTVNWIPNVTFGGGGMPNAANINLTNLPLAAKYPTYSITDNITRTMNAHTLKAGIFFNRQSQLSAQTAQRGSLDFSVDALNPLDTNYTFSNAILGVYKQAQQQNRSYNTARIWKAYEWFVQDSWKVHRRFTLEIGLRFVKAFAPYSPHPVGMFDPTAWTSANAPVLIRPTLVNGQGRGIDPTTGTIYPAVAIGQLAPGVGNVANGVIFNTQSGVPRGLIKDPGVQYNPRFGFAWDVFGNGRTALRGGFGLFQSSGVTGEPSPGSETVVPLAFNVTIPYSTLSALDTSGGLLSPQTFTYFENPMKLATSYNMNLGIQHNLGWGIVLDTGYVGNLGRHLMWQFDQAAVPLGANFRPENFDPRFTNRTPLAANFLRSAYLGFGGVNYNNWGGTSNYHSWQTTINRRFANGFQFGTSYTWSKFMSSVDFDANAVSPFVPARQWNYGLSTYDRTHNLRMNFLYQLPRLWYSNPISKWALNGWEIGGINAFISGEPKSIGFNNTNFDITGTPSQNPRIDVAGPIVLPKSERTFSKNFRTENLRLPTVGTLGNAGRVQFRGPGIENWDLSVFKKFPIREPFTLQLRAEAYNAFNHTQFANLDTTARFDAVGNLQATTLGQFTQSRTPRQLQLALRFTF